MTTAVAAASSRESSCRLVTRELAPIQPHVKNSTSQDRIASFGTLYTGESTGICPVSFRYRPIE